MNCPELAFIAAVEARGTDRIGIAPRGPEWNGFRWPPLIDIVQSCQPHTAPMTTSYTSRATGGDDDDGEDEALIILIEIDILTFPASCARE